MLPKAPTSSRRRLKQGFVLVSVLLIVALATVLVVVASMMAQLERRAAYNTAKVDQARANALFALDVALNQLQTAAGPDQRITARAEILDANPATTNVDGVTQPFWTGVWTTGTNSLDVANAGIPQRQSSFNATTVTPTTSEKVASARWLVSGTNSVLDPTTFSDSRTNGPAATAAVLARALGPSASSVTVPLVPLRNGSVTNGSYAYWVSDEGVKARINLSDPTFGVSPSADASKNRAHFLAPQGVDTSKGLFGTNASIDLRTATYAGALPKINSLASLQNVGSFSSTIASSLASDATTVSRSVLADVRRGGLQKDLTAGLEDTTQFASLTNSFGYGAGMLYRSDPASGLTVPGISTGITPPTDGILWSSLFYHYNSYKGSMPAAGPAIGSPTTPTSSGNPATLPQVQSFRVYSAGSTATPSKTGFLAPVPIAYRLDIAISSYLDNGLWKLRIHYYPQLALWNPYSARLSTTTYQFRRDVGAFATAGVPTTMSATVGSTVIPPVQINQAPNGRQTLMTQSGDCAVLEPGETRVFALDRDVPVPGGNVTAAITFSSLLSNPQMSPDFSQYTDIPGFAGTANGTDRVSVGLSQVVLRCQNVDTFCLPSALKFTTTDGASRYIAGGNWNLAAAASTWPANLQIQQLNGAPRRLIGFYVRQKGLQTSSSARTYSNAASTIPLFSGNSAAVNPIEDIFSPAWQEVYLSPLGVLYQNGQTDLQMAPSGNFWETSFGSESAGAAPPSLRCVLRDVPNQPMSSLGQFMHMPAMNFWSIGSFQNFAAGSMFVGGSYASPTIPTDKTAISHTVGVSTGGVQNVKLFLDDSFVANEALFDRFFLSTLPPAGGAPGGTTYPPLWTAFNAANNGTVLKDASLPLLNARIKPYAKGGSPPRMTDLRDMTRAAANLMLEGGFNVNSTSVEAWKAFLASQSGNSLQLWNASTKSPDTVSPGAGTPFSRFWSASSLTSPNTPWSGLRVLSDSELTELALRIVQQVKLRGPFLSLSDFLNRRLGPAGPLSLCGTLQAAIDTMTPDINAAVKVPGVGTPVNALAANTAMPYPQAPDFIPANMKDGAGNTWSTSLGMPGCLMQQDIVQAIAPGLRARSDTFAVRVYGSSKNPASGAIEGEAWAEAIVQRLPDYLDQSDPALGNPANDAVDPSATNLTNRTFGRRFKIVSFRWMNANEI